MLSDTLWIPDISEAAVLHYQKGSWTVNSFTLIFHRTEEEIVLRGFLLCGSGRACVILIIKTIIINIYSL